MYISSLILALFLLTILLLKPNEMIVKEFILEKTVSPPDNIIENFFCSDFNELIIFLTFFLVKDLLFPLAEMK